MKDKKLCKLIIINFILFLIFQITPNTEIKQEIINTIEEVKEEIIAEVPEVIEEEETKEIVKNTKLTTDTDLRILSNLTEEDYKTILTDYPNLQGLEKTLVEIEKNYQINGLYILGLACEESGYGTSAMAKNKNNLCGVCAYDSDTSKATKFKSKSSCLTFVANFLKNDYLTENGKYFNGYTAKDIDKKYCSDKEHASKICSIVNRLTEKI